jgi:hypothetical protein
VLEHPELSKIQGPILETSADDELQRQEKSVGEQEMSLAAVAKQERAQRGSWETSEGRSVAVDVDVEEEVVDGADMVAVEGEVLLVTWAVAAPRRSERLMSEKRIVAGSSRCNAMWFAFLLWLLETRALDFARCR